MKKTMRTACQPCTIIHELRALSLFNDGPERGTHVSFAPLPTLQQRYPPPVVPSLMVPAGEFHSLVHMW